MFLLTQLIYENITSHQPPKITEIPHFPGCSLQNIQPKTKSTSHYILQATTNNNNNNNNNQKKNEDMEAQVSGNQILVPHDTGDLAGGGGGGAVLRLALLPPDVASEGLLPGWLRGRWFFAPWKHFLIFCRV